MADYNKILDAGDVTGGIVNVVTEISMGSKLKIEWNRKKAIFELDRVEPGIFAKPCNYGFIPQTLDEDGDELDILLICDEPVPTGVVLKGRVIGIMNFEDDNEMDHKVVVVPEDDRHTGNAINSLQDLPKQWLSQVEHHFNHYKDLKKPGSTKVLGWGSVEDAKNTIKECQERWVDQA
ncbi:inorganic diphosphatase [Candidatus Saccharibacteria bacterium]|nr:inorganic diphosphatase [Candidatus Saccharibacteria bacterium]